jgi:hypothetical protein
VQVAAFLLDILPGIIKGVGNLYEGNIPGISISYICWRSHQLFSVRDYFKQEKKDKDKDKENSK